MAKFPAKKSPSLISQTSLILFVLFNVFFCGVWIHFFQKIGKDPAHIWSLVSLSVVFGFGLFLTYFHFQTLRAHKLELALFHANKVACLEELSMSLAKDLQTPLMKIQGYNGRLKAHFKKDRMDEVSSVWTFTHEIDESVTQMRSHIERLM